MCFALQTVPDMLSIAYIASMDIECPMQPQVDTVKKFGAGSNKVTGVGKDAAKLDRETEELHHDRHDAMQICLADPRLKRSNATDLFQSLSKAGQVFTNIPKSFSDYAGCPQS